MTPAILFLKTTNIQFEIHEYDHDSNRTDYGIEAASKLSLDPTRVIKTLIIELNPSGFIVAMIPISEQLSMKKLARVAGAKHATMAPSDKIKSLTGYLTGGISPLGQKRPLACYLDQAAATSSTIFISGGKRGIEIELSPQDLIELTKAYQADLIA
jgi:Cys-tRNA(Pro)/Cys-tRNA(Cys) deacylase